MGKGGLPVLRLRSGRRPSRAFSWALQIQSQVGVKMDGLTTSLKCLPNLKQEGFLHESHLLFYLGNLSIITAQSIVQMFLVPVKLSLAFPGT